MSTTGSGIISAALVAMLAATLTGCQTDLTRAKAKALIDPVMKPAYMELYEHTVLLQVGRYGACGNQSDYVDPARNVEYAVFLKAGYLTLDRLRPGLWNVQLTQRGSNASEGEKYAHKVQGPCDYWQITIPLAKYDHYTISGIVSDERHATGDIQMFFLLTPAAVATMPLIEAAAYEACKVKQGKLFAELCEDRTFALPSEYTDIKGAHTNGQGKLEYTMEEKAAFVKYDDGWRIDKEAK